MRMIKKSAFGKEKDFHNAIQMKILFFDYLLIAPHRVREILYIYIHTERGRREML